MRRTIARCSLNLAWDYDIVIGGGSVTGAALASKILHSTKGGVKIGIIGTGRPKPLEECVSAAIPDVRVYALSPQSIGFLKSINCWHHFENRTQQFKYMQVWDATGPGSLRFNSDHFQTHELGRIAEDLTIQSSIYESLKEFSDNVDFISDASINNLVVPDHTHSTGPGPAEVTYTQSVADQRISKSVKCRYP